MRRDWTVCSIGLAAGAFGGLIGLGGGVVMIPLLVGLLRLRQHRAHGTSLVALVFTGLAGAATYWSHGAVDVYAAVALAVPATLTARLGARYANSLPERKLRRAFGAFLVIVVLLLLLKPYVAAGVAPASAWVKVAILAAIGTVTGFISGMMGIGGGSLMVPAMVLLVGFTQVVAQGTSLLAMVPAGSAGAHQHWQLGNVARRALAPLILGIVVGTWLGSQAALWLDEWLLRTLFAVVIGYTGVRYLWPARGGAPAHASSAAGERPGPNVPAEGRPARPRR